MIANLLVRKYTKCYSSNKKTAHVQCLH